MRWILTGVIAGGGLLAAAWLSKVDDTAPTSRPAAKPTARAERPDGPLALIPADCLVAWKGEPISAAMTAQHQSALDVLLRTVTKVAGGKIKPAERMTLELFRGFGEVIGHPFALALLDADTIPTEHSVKGDNFKIVLAVDVNGQIGPLMKIVHNAVNELTDESMASIEEKKADGIRYVELTDQRLPDWCHIAWGQINDYFVLTFGVDVWPQVAAVAGGKEKSVTSDEWVASVRREMADVVQIEVVVDAKRIREKLDPSTGGKATAYFKEWGAEKMDRAFWALGLADRALYCEAFFRMPQRTVRRLYADPDAADADLLSVVPPEARYAIYNVPMREFLPQLISSYYATRPERVRNKAVKLWERIQREHGFDARKDILANLGDRIVLHNWPEHPLHLPLMFTTVAPIKQNAEAVKSTIETMCTAWQAGMQEIADREGRDNPIHHDPDGFWYISFGFIDGVAWTVTDKYIITSWSRWALRTYLDQMGEQVGWKD